MTIAHTDELYTTEDRVLTAYELVARYNITADEVTVTPDGIALRGVDLETIVLIAPALALTPSDDEERVYRGTTFDGIPVTVEQSA